MLSETEWAAPSLYSSAAPTSDIGYHTALLGPGTGLAASSDGIQPTVETPPGSALPSCQSAPAAGSGSDRQPASATTPFSAPSAVQSGPYQPTLIQKSPLGSGISSRGIASASEVPQSASAMLEEQAARAEALIQMKLEEVRHLRAQVVQMFQEQTLGARRGTETESSDASHGPMQCQGNQSPGGGLRYQGTGAQRPGSESGRAGSSSLNPASASYAPPRGPLSRASLGGPASYRQGSPPRAQRIGHHSRANSRDSRPLQPTSSLFRSALTNHSARVSLQGQLQPGSGGSAGSGGSMPRTLAEGGAGPGSPGAGTGTSPPDRAFDAYAAMRATAGAGPFPKPYRDVDYTQDPTFRFTGASSGGSGTGPAAGLPGGGASGAAPSAGPGPHSASPNQRSIHQGFLGVGTAAGQVAVPQSPQDAQVSSPTTPAARRLRSVATSTSIAAGAPGESQKSRGNSKHKNRVHPGPHPVHSTNKGLLGSPMAAPGRPRPLVSVDGPGSSAGPSLQHESAQDESGLFGRVSRWIQTTLGFGGFGQGSRDRRAGPGRTEGPLRAPRRVLTVVPFPGQPSPSRRAHPTC